MNHSSLPLFGKTKFIENQLNEFFDRLSEGGMYFEMGMVLYLETEALTPGCEEKMEQINQVKHRCNNLRREIEAELYTEMLIPDARGDVLSLLEDLYYLIGLIGDNFQNLMIEEPIIPTPYHSDFKQLVSMGVQCLETIVLTSRAFFRDPRTVRDYAYKVRVYEAEADQISFRLKRGIFRSVLPLAHKTQLRDVIDVIDALADASEDVADKLSIYAIKRAL